MKWQRGLYRLCGCLLWPYLFNFTDMFRMLKTQQACMVVRDADALSKAWHACLHGTHGSDMANRAYAAMMDAQGVLTRYMAFFAPWLTSRVS